MTNTVETLEAMSAKDLREMAKAAEMPGASRAKKSELVAFLAPKVKAPKAKRTPRVALPNGENMGRELSTEECEAFILAAREAMPKKLAAEFTATISDDGKAITFTTGRANVIMRTAVKGGALKFRCWVAGATRATCFDRSTVEASTPGLVANIKDAAKRPAVKVEAPKAKTRKAKAKA